eukprot:TRINITY_DN12467_c0_g1_i2.p1 TRINITY_DN12467_c0_g1~~TRINITY_DN12467_c0_g1_i2.p1  ORF type:complete len:247 (+),score=33.71 TRINITY_DN12467_c0_g1_i2:74-814(+)
MRSAAAMRRSVLCCRSVKIWPYYSRHVKYHSSSIIWNKPFPEDENTKSSGETNIDSTETVDETAHVDETVDETTVSEDEHYEKTMRSLKEFDQIHREYKLKMIHKYDKNDGHFIFSRIPEAIIDLVGRSNFIVTVRPNLLIELYPYYTTITVGNESPDYFIKDFESDDVEIEGRQLATIMEAIEKTKSPGAKILTILYSNNDDKINYVIRKITNGKDMNEIWPVNDLIIPKPRWDHIERLTFFEES